jgi:hypothetical protein
MAAWTTVETFESYTVGDAAPISPSFGGANALRTIVAGLIGKAAQLDGSAGVSGGHVYEYDTHPVIALNSSTAASVFFRAQFAAFGSSDSLFSLSADGAAVYGDLNIIFRANSSGRLQVHTSGSYTDTPVTLSTGTAYNFWVVINNSANTWALYTSTGEDDGALAASGLTFRNTVDRTIDTFYYGTNGGSKYIIDNLYIDTSAANTTYPSPLPKLQLISISPN